MLCSFYPYDNNSFVLPLVDFTLHSVSSLNFYTVLILQKFVFYSWTLASYDKIFSTLLRLTPCFSSFFFLPLTSSWPLSQKKSIGRFLIIRTGKLDNNGEFCRPSFAISNTIISTLSQLNMTRISFNADSSVLRS